MRSLVQIAVNLLVIALVALGGYAILNMFEPKEGRRFSMPRSEKSWTVDGQRAEPGDYRARLSAYGRLQSARSLAVRAPLSGTAMSLGDAMANGGQVEQGALLVEIDPVSLNRQVEQIKTQLAELDAQIAEAGLNLRLLKGQLERDRAQLTLAQNEEARSAELVEQGFATTTQLDQARRSALSAEQAVFQREQAIEQAQSRSLQLQQSKLRLTSQRDEALDRAQDSRILAPMAGVLSEVAVAQGEEINANAVLARLQSVRDLEVEFELSERDFARFIDPATGRNLLVGSTASVAWSPGPTPLTFDATVERFAPALNQQTAGVLVFASLQLAPEQASPPLAAFVEVTLMDRPYQNVLQLPQSALHAGSRVFEIGRDRRLIGHEAVRLRDEGSTVVLRVQGLPEGACLMTTNLPVAGDGVKVAMVGDPAPRALGAGGRPGGRPGTRPEGSPGGRPGGRPGSAAGGAQAADQSAEQSAPQGDGSSIRGQANSGPDKPGGRPKPQDLGDPCDHLTAQPSDSAQGDAMKKGQRRQGQERQGQERQGQERQGQERQSQERQGQRRQGEGRQGEGRQGEGRKGQPQSGAQTPAPKEAASHD